MKSDLVIVGSDNKVRYSDKGMKILDTGLELSWEEIDKYRNQIRFVEYVLVTFKFSYGRANYYNEKYLLTKKEWADLKVRMIDNQIYFGEIAGKHSEVIYNVSEDSITENDRLEDIIKFHAANGMQDINADPIGTFLDSEADGVYE